MKTTHVIVEFDKDYRTVTATEYRDFETDKEAKTYAREKSWSGFDYYAYDWKSYFNRRGDLS